MKKKFKQQQLNTKATKKQKKTTIIQPQQPRQLNTNLNLNVITESPTSMCVRWQTAALSNFCSESQSRTFQQQQDHYAKRHPVRRLPDSEAPVER